MNRKLRLATLLVAATSGLVLAGAAFASYTPRLAVSHGATARGGIHPTTIHITVPSTDDATAVSQIYVPSGYQLQNAATGASLGSASGVVLARDNGLTLPLEGTVTAGDPAQFTGPPNNACSPGTHAQVWVLSLSVAGQTITIPIYVDPTTGAETGLGAFKIRACFGPPDTPTGTPGRSPFGAQLLDAQFTVTSAFSVPSTAGLLAWRATFTPWTPKTGVPNVAGTVEARSFVGVPGSVSLKAAYARKSNRFGLTGKVSEGPNGVAGAKVQVWRGPTKAVKRVGLATAKSDGTYSAGGRLTPKKPTYFQTQVTVPERDYSAGCSASISPSGVPCVSSTLGAFSAVSALVRIKP